MLLPSYCQNACTAVCQRWQLHPCAQAAESAAPRSSCSSKATDGQANSATTLTTRNILHHDYQVKPNPANGWRHTFYNNTYIPYPFCRHAAQLSTFRDLLAVPAINPATVYLLYQCLRGLSRKDFPASFKLNKTPPCCWGKSELWSNAAASSERAMNCAYHQSVNHHLC